MSLCESLFFPAHEESVPETLPTYTRADERMIVHFDGLLPRICTEWVYTCISLFAIYAKTPFKLPRKSPMC